MRKQVLSLPHAVSRTVRYILCKNMITYKKSHCRQNHYHQQGWEERAKQQPGNNKTISKYLAEKLGT